MAIARRACSRLQEGGARSRDDPLPLVAGSVGPYGACLHDSSEYRGEYVESVSRDVLRAWHRPRIEALLEAGVDLLAVETVPAQVQQISIVFEWFFGVSLSEPHTREFGLRNICGICLYICHITRFVAMCLWSTCSGTLKCRHYWDL